VPVIAAAQGRVKAVRDGETDGGRARKTAGKDCGNGVVIDHGGDWSTQYCHMREGCVVVRKGDVVNVGQQLGEVGFSGNTEFAHLHLTVRYKKQIIDSFSETGSGPGRCSGGQSLWTATAARALAYSPVDVTAVGIATRKPRMQETAAGAHSKGVINGESEILAAWVLAWHVKQGDVVTLRLVGPDGQAVVANTRTVKRDRTRQFYFAGKRNPGRWPSGQYRVSATAKRPS
jgi:murein DD-endopeptidase MepM/ murein hydrolase activator NlpD